MLGLSFVAALGLSHAVANVIPRNIQPRAISNSGPSAANRTRLEDAFAAAVQEQRVPGVAVLALNRDGSVIFEDGWGTINIDDQGATAVTLDTKMGIASMTKAVTVTAALQLIEQGKLGLDDLVETHVPDFGDLQVLEGFDNHGQPILRVPKTKATILNLLTHTSGQPYLFLNDNLGRWQKWSRTLNGTVPPTPLGADPGTGWFYGYGEDWTGLVVEAISGQRLDIYFEDHIFKPLGIKNSGLLTAEIYSHIRAGNGTISASLPKPQAPQEHPSGGAFLTSTANDYSAFLLALINNGTHPTTGGTILQPSTFQDYVFTDLIPRAVPGYGSLNFRHEGEPVGDWVSNTPSLSNSIQFLPGVRKGWSANFLINTEDVPNGRRKGSGAWAGINNLFYWVDPNAGTLGVVFTNLLPFLDRDVLDLFSLLEEVVYSS